MTKIKGWEKTRDDLGAVVWIRNKPTEVRLAIINRNIDPYSAKPLKSGGGWELEVTGSDNKKVTYGIVAKNKADAISRATQFMKNQPGVTERFKPAKGEIGKVEAKARSLMGGKWNGEKLPMLYYRILEDANYHTLNNKLTKAGAFGEFREEDDGRGGKFYVPTNYGNDDAFEKYRAEGGRSWEL